MADSSSKRLRSRSRSPPRRAPKSSRGFRWKDSRANDDSYDRHSSGRDYGRRRDYRDRSHDRDRGGDRRDNRHDRHDRHDRSDRHDRRDYRPRSRSPRRHDSSSKDKGDDIRKEKKEKEKKAPKAAVIAPGQELIVVNVNDRLGTKTAIPCLPSDTIAQFKLMLAARIGREPGQIMLRRQGERPFKDPLTLEDYGISNGVQLDLEIDTGD